MPDFAYTARDLTGRQVTGTLSAGSKHEALAALGQQALFPVKVEAAKAAGLNWRAKRVKPQLMATTYGQLADLLRSGVPLLKSLDVLRRQASNAALIEVLERLHSGIEEGGTLAECMAAHPKVFSQMAVSMLRAGGEGGFLEEALERVAEFTEKQEDMKSRVIGAVAYPAFLAVVGTSVVLVLLIFFVPKFDGLFARLRARGELPVLTDWLLTTSATLQHWWLAILAVLTVLGAFVRFRLGTDAGRLWRDRATLRLPLAGKVFLELAVARFCRVLGTLLRNGVPILRSLEIASDGTGNRVLGAAIQEAAENISAGQSLAQPLAACGHFPQSVVEMIAVAEESNTLDRVLINVADGLERRTWRQLELLVRLLEPVMLLALALVVLMLAVALLLPVIKMSTAI